MAVDIAALKAHLNITDATDDALIGGQLAAAQAHLAAQLGFALDDDDQFPDGTPPDVDQAVLLLAAHWYENREASFAGAVPLTMIPLGVETIIANRRTYTFGLPNE